MSELVGSIVILAGAFFLFSAGVGLLRMPDVFTRIQAGTKASTLGNILVLAGLGIYHPDWALKLLIDGCVAIPCFGYLSKAAAYSFVPCRKPSSPRSGSVWTTLSKNVLA